MYDEMITNKQTLFQDFAKMAEDPHWIKLAIRWVGVYAVISLKIFNANDELHFLKET